jgi:hypothetical protein
MFFYLSSFVWPAAQPAHEGPPPAPQDVEAFLNAVEAGDIGSVRESLDGGDVGVNDSDADGFTALYGASSMGHLALVNLLIVAWATVDQA